MRENMCLCRPDQVARANSRRSAQKRHHQQKDSRGKSRRTLDRQADQLLLSAVVLGRELPARSVLGSSHPSMRSLGRLHLSLAPSRKRWTVPCLTPKRHFPYLVSGVDAFDDAVQGRAHRCAIRYLEFEKPRRVGCVCGMGTRLICDPSAEHFPNVRWDCVADERRLL